MRLAAFSLVAVAPAFAHNTWIERDADSAPVVRYGDYGARIEKSPGPLDNVDNLRAWSLDADGVAQPVVSEKGADGILLKTSSGRPLFTQYISHSVKGHGGPSAFRTFATRWQPEGPVADKPCLTLDLLPDASRTSVRVLFRGTPLAGATIAVYGEGSESEKQSVVTDAEGRAKFAVRKTGTVLLRCKKSIPLQGYHEGISYEDTTYITTLTLARAVR